MFSAHIVLHYKYVAEKIYPATIAIELHQDIEETNSERLRHLPKVTQLRDDQPELTFWS